MLGQQKMAFLLPVSGIQTSDIHVAQLGEYAEFLG